MDEASFKGYGETLDLPGPLGNSARPYFSNDEPMTQIDLKKKGGVTLQDVSDLLASGDDSRLNQLQVSTAGVAFLSQSPGIPYPKDNHCYFESWIEGNGYVGAGAANDASWVRRVHAALLKNWPDLELDSYIDSF